MKFKLGDRVIGVGRQGKLSINDLEGTIVKIYTNDCGVEFDNANKDFHNCLGNGKPNHCWWCSYGNIKHILYISGTRKNPINNLTAEKHGLENIQKGRAIINLAGVRKEEKTPSGYHRDSEGFLTNPDNWKPGKWLI